MLEARRPQAGLKKAGWELIGSDTQHEHEEVVCIKPRYTQVHQ